MLWIEKIYHQKAGILCKKRWLSNHLPLSSSAWLNNLITVLWEYLRWNKSSLNYLWSKLQALDNNPSSNFTLSLTVVIGTQCKIELPKAKTLLMSLTWTLLYTDESSHSVLHEVIFPTRGPDWDNRWNWPRRVKLILILLTVTKFMIVEECNHLLR